MYFETAFKEKVKYDKRINKNTSAYYALSKETKFFKDIFNRWYTHQNDESLHIKNIKHVCKKDLYKINQLGLAI